MWSLRWPGNDAGVSSNLGDGFGLLTLAGESVQRKFTEKIPRMRRSSSGTTGSLDHHCFPALADHGELMQRTDGRMCKRVGRRRPTMGSCVRFTNIVKDGFPLKAYDWATSGQGRAGLRFCDDALSHASDISIVSEWQLKLCDLSASGATKIIQCKQRKNTSYWPRYTCVCIEFSLTIDMQRMCIQVSAIGYLDWWTKRR